MKNKIVKWIGAACIAMMALCIGAIPVHAEEIQQLHIEGYDLAENRMRIYLNGNENILSDKDNLEIILGDTAYQAETVTSFEDTNEGISYLVLVDVSGSVTKSDIANAREILTELVDAKADADNMSIVEIRNEIVKTDFVSDKELLLEQIQAIERTGEDTNLYLAVREALKILNEEFSCHNKKCLIIISDGMDDQKNGILFEDVRDAIKATNIPICTLAMPWGGSKEDEPDKVMKSFTENAAGGIHVRYRDTEFDNLLIAQCFSEFAHSGVVAEISLEGFEPNGSMVTLSVDITGGIEPIQGDSCQIPSHAISSVITVESKENMQEEAIIEESVPEENVDGTSDDTESKASKWYYIFLLIFGIAVVVTVVIVCSKKKQADAGAELEKEEAVDISAQAVAAGNSDDNNVLKDGNAYNPEGETPTIDGQLECTVDGEKGCVEYYKPNCITLTEIGPAATRVLTVEYKQWITIGRKKSADLVIADDNQVSGLHCKLWMEGQQMYIEDLDSTNGTFLNGIPVTVKQHVKPEDTLHIGAFEYRISWE